MDTSPSESGVFRWAWYRAKEVRARFWIAAGLFSLAVAFVLSRVPLPPHPTAQQNLVASVLAIVVAVAATSVGTYICALAAAPFQQRNALRTQLSQHAATISALRVGPVSQAHGDRLRQMAGQLQECLEIRKPLDYGTDPDIWQRAFHQHFPDLVPALDKVGQADAAFATLDERLRREAAAAGMDTPPWTHEEFLPAMGEVIKMRAMQRILGATFNFDWQELGPGSVYLGDPVYTGVQVLQNCDPSDVPARQQDFEKFFRRAELWPEAADIRVKLDERSCADEAAIELLGIVANTDPITSRCFLCMGTDR